MELKNAVAVCLISMLSATLVVLVIRAFDLHAASRLEPQLAKIAEELETIRKQGGITTTSGGAVADLSADDALMVYYLHGVRCPTCLAAEANAHETVQSEFAAQLESGEVVWKVLDYLEDPVGQKLASDFQVTVATVVLAKMENGQVEDWKRLDQVLALAEDKPALAEYVRDEINQMLEAPGTQSGPAPEGDPAEIPLPTDPAAIPIPTDPPDIPVPQ